MPTERADPAGPWLVPVVGLMIGNWTEEPDCHAPQPVYELAVPGNFINNRYCSSSNLYCTVRQLPFNLMRRRAAAFPLGSGCGRAGLGEERTEGCETRRHAEAPRSLVLRLPS